MGVFTKGVTNGAVVQEINPAAHENNRKVDFRVSLPSPSQISVL